MKKIFWIFAALVMLFGLIFIFSGCELLKNAAENLQQDAELAAKAVSDAGYKNYSNPTNPKLVTGSISGDVSGSIYVSQLDTGYTTFSLTFTDHQVTVDDDNGKPVTVTLNGTVNFGYSFNTSTYTFKMVVYSSSLSVKVGSDDLGNVPVDMLFEFTASATTGTFSATIEGSVGDYSVNTSTSVTFDATPFLIAQ